MTTVVTHKSSRRVDVLKTLTVVAAALIITACGSGGDDAKDAAYKDSTGSSANPSAAQISSGKVLYNSNCASCHGANMPTAKDSNRILSAIAANTGGMGVLSTRIQASQANDIAAYLAFGL